MTRGIDRLLVAGLCVLAGLAGGGSVPAAIAAGDDAVDEASLGRLFLTPEQRRALDEQRANPSGSVDSGLPRDLLPARAAVDRRVVLNGVVRRGREDAKVWINGQPADPAGRLRVRRGPDAENRVVVESTASAAVARLKPGQAWDPRTGTITDCTGCGAPPPATDAAPAPAPAPGPDDGPDNGPAAAAPATEAAVPAVARVPPATAPAAP